MVLLDSGTSEHIINDKTLAVLLDPIAPIKLKKARSDAPLYATKCGTLNMQTLEGTEFTIEKVLFAEKLNVNVISTKKLNKQGFDVNFKAKGVVEVKEPTCNFVVAGELYNKIKLLINFSYVNVCGVDLSNLWHCRFGHISFDNFLKIKSLNFIDDPKFIKNIKPFKDICDSCIKARQKRISMKNSKNKSHIVRPLYAIHSDLCGKISPPTKSNEDYFATFIDDYTQYCTIYYLSKKQLPDKIHYVFNPPNLYITQLPNSVK